MKQASEKSYAVAVCLSAVFGVLGIHHFYLGRYAEGMVDLGLSVMALYLLLMGEIFLAFIAFAVDAIHTLVVTIRLLTGCCKDGAGRYVCYPGQRL